MTFEVRWLLAECKWNELQREQQNPLYRYGPLPRHDLLDGLIQLAANDRSLFPAALLSTWKERLLNEARRSGRSAGWYVQNLEHGVNVSVIDLAFGLSRVSGQIKAREIAIGSTTRFSARESSLEIVFTLTDDGIKITSNWTDEIPGHFIETSETDFHAGVSMFLHDLAVEIYRRAPDALEWEALKDVKAHLDEP